jgi:hypothetical protein
MNLALFDLDNTLLAGDSDFEWAQFLISKGRRRPRSAGSQKHRFYEQYKAGTLDIYEFLNFQLAPADPPPACRTRCLASANTWNATSADHERGSQGCSSNSTCDNGDLCAIVTATNSFVTGPIAREFGIPHLIATIPAVDPQTGHFPARRGTPSFREGKINASKPGWNRSACGGAASRQLFLQRLAQRPAADEQGQNAGRRRSG